MSAQNSMPNEAPRPLPRVLVVDDEPDLRELLELTLVRMGLDVDSATSVSEARGRLGRHAYALCLTDMRLPDASGMELVETIARDYPATLVAVITAYGSADNAVAALKAGAFDYLPKPVALEQLRSLVQSAVRAYRSAPDGAQNGGGQHGAANGRHAVRAARGAAAGMTAGMTSANDPAPMLARLLGDSAPIREVRSLVQRVARSQAPVSLCGESGSGKELVARAIHDCSGRREGPFIPVNCGAIPEQLMEAEFFGYRKGAFTGADAERDGFFQAARGGTLFLDEVADLPLAMQVKLLRAIQERSVRRVGGTNEEPVDVRLISATHQNLGQCVAEGRFRQDLYYRLNVIDIHLPPLRERSDDIPVLAQHLLAQLAPGLTLTAAAIDKLMTHDFPGNVRELVNILERSSAFAESEIIDARDLQLPAQNAVSPATATHALAVPQEKGAAPGEGLSAIGIAGSLPDHLDRIEREIIERALAQTRYNRTAAAELLGITFRQLRYRMQRLNIR